MNEHFEERLQALEAAVAELQRQNHNTNPKQNWLDKITGSFTDDSIVDEVLAYGREFRYADRPTDDESTDRVDLVDLVEE